MYELIKDGKWNRDLLLQEFEENDRMPILRIPFSLGKLKVGSARQNQVQEHIQSNLAIDK